MKFDRRKYEQRRDGDLDFCGTADPRKAKRIAARFLQEHGGGLPQEAWDQGCWDGENGRPYRNPYPAGIRHDNYHAGYHLGRDSDPMGAHHGHNT